MIDSNNQSLCPAPWVSLYVEPSGRVDNCCVGQNHLGNIKENTVQEIIFGPSNQQVQKNMLKGQWPKGCAWCENKSHSLQKRMFDIFPSRNEKDYQQGSFQLQYLDARWSNTCNLACVYCTSIYSSTWAQELNEPVVRIEREQKNELLDYVLDHVELLKEVYLAGGEPLLMKENEQLIAAIKQHNPDCHILVNTNLTQIKNSKIFNDLLTLKNCSWLVSIDDSYNRFEYMRYPAIWTEFAENLETLASRTSGFQISFNMVFTSLNALTIWDTVDWLMSKNFEYFTIQLYNNGNTPQFPLDVRSMPKAYQQATLDRMKDKKYQNLLGWKSTHDHLAELIENPSDGVLQYLQDLDQRRGLNSQQVFPEVYKHLKQGI